MSRKFLVCVMSLVILGFMGTVYAQDLCDKYHDKYRICVEKRDAGRNMNKDACWTLTKSGSSACNGAGCYWDEDKGMCLIDICLGDTDLDGYVVGGDGAHVDRDYGRDDCPSTPSCPEPVWKIFQDGTAQCVTWVDATNSRFAVYDVETPGDTSDDLVLDKDTGLIWARNALLAGEMKDWQDAIDLCRQLTLGNRKGWRLPTTEELSSLIDTVSNPPYAVPAGHPFYNLPGSHYWSSTTYEDDSSMAGKVSFYDGQVFADNKTAGTGYFLPVFGGNGYATGNW